MTNKDMIILFSIKKLQKYFTKISDGYSLDFRLINFKIKYFFKEICSI